MKCLYEGLTHDKIRVYDNGITIVIRKTKTTYEVFYETDGFPLTFGFGLPDKGYTMSQVWGYAEANAHRICMAIFMD